MWVFRKYIQGYQTISWLLIAALVIQLLVQLQFHLHHDDDLQELLGQDHVIDYHLFTDDHPADDQTDENVGGRS